MKRLCKNGLFVLTLVNAVVAGADELGRLFFTPEQRAQLDRGIPQKDQQDGSTNMEQTLTINGIVQKDGGKRTAWINGVPQVSGNSDEQTPESVQVAVPGRSQPVKVKVGQKIFITLPPAEKK